MNSYPLQHPEDRSAVEFETSTRVHVSIAVRDLERSRSFYETLLGAAPTKVRPGYARFEVADPPVHLALNQGSAEAPSAGPGRGAHHFGIQVKDAAAVAAGRERLEAAGLAVAVEERVTCCHSMQTKVWAKDPDGNAWEIFVVVDDRVDAAADDDDKVGASASSRSVAAGCCDSLEGCG